MAYIYKECDGNTTRNMTVNASLGSPTYHRQYTQGTTTITEAYKRLTFTCNPAPISAIGLRIRYSYKVAYSYDGTAPTNFYLTPTSVVMPQGQTSLVIDVPTDREWCHSSGDDNDGYQDFQYVQ